MSTPIEDKIKQAKQTVADIEFLKKNSGKMRLVGYSGKVGDDEALRIISINEISGMVAIPAAMLELAKIRLEQLEKQVA